MGFTRCNLYRKLNLLVLFNRDKQTSQAVTKSRRRRSAFLTMDTRNLRYIRTNSQAYNSSPTLCHLECGNTNSAHLDLIQPHIRKVSPKRNNLEKYQNQYYLKEQRFFLLNAQPRTPRILDDKANDSYLPKVLC